MFTDASMRFSQLWPTWLIVSVAAALVAALASATFTLLRKRVSPRWVAALGGLRLTATVVFSLLLLHPILFYRHEVEQRPELLVLVDTSRSMAGPAATGQDSRIEECLSACRQGELASALHDRFRVNWFAFDSIARPLDESELPQLKADGASTRLAESLSSAYEQMDALGRTPNRVLLLSDGKDRGAADPVETARRLGLPVDGLPPTAPPADPGAVRIADVRCARRVLLGSETHFRLTLHGDSVADRDRPTAVRLVENGKEVWNETLTLKAGRNEQTFALAHRPDSAGLKQYEYQLASGAQEPYRVNVQVVDDKYEILILENTWRWEYKFLHRLFEDDPSFRFTAFLARGRGTYTQFGSPDRRVNLIGPPQGRADLQGFDTFILGDVDPTRWPRGLAASLTQLVQDEGKSLVLIAGPNLSRFTDVPELHALLPVELTRESGQPVEGPIDVRMRPDASSSPFFFQLRAGDNDKLPALDQVYPALRKRPGATVLLEAVNQRNPYGNLIVLAEHTVGRGRVLFIGTDTLWKWQTLAPARSEVTPYSLFWQQACRALTPQRSQAGLVNLWLTPQRTQSALEQPLTIHAEIDSTRPLPKAALQATVLLPDERRLPLSFTAEADNPQRLHATFTPPQPGQLQIAAQLIAEGKTLAEATTAIQITASGGEESDGGVDHTFLARLTDASGGRILDAAHPETWPAVEGPPTKVMQSNILDLSLNFVLLLLLCGLLGLDWLLRIYKGLV